MLAVAEQLGPRTILLAALALVLLLGLLVFGLRGCHKPAANSGSYGTTYDWTCLSWEGDRLHYYSDTLGSRLGIDVSEVQGEIDWNAVSNDGIGFAMIRSGYRGIDGGVVNDDIYFEQNLQGAKNAHLDTGVYFYSQALTEDEAREEAKQVLQALNGRKLTLPVAYDFEKTSDGTGRADYLENNQIDANAAAFCDTIRKAGYEAVIYGNPSDLAFYSKSTLDKYGIWLAQYGDVPMLDTGFCIWQYSENGTVAGISTVVDLNLNIYSK